MNASPRAAVIRLSILLLVTCAGAFAWEASRNAGMRPVTGEVVGVQQVRAGKGGDDLQFTIRYRVDGKRYRLVTRRGIVDALTSLRGLDFGDRVPLTVNPKAPWRAVLDTVSGRFPITLCFLVLALMFAMVVIALAVRGRVSRSAPSR